MAIPYPSDILIPYLIEPVGEFLNAWGPQVLFPLAHWAVLIACVVVSAAIVRVLWWDISTGGPLNRVQRKTMLSHQAMEAAREAALRKISEVHGLRDGSANQFGENQQRQ